MRININRAIDHVLDHYAEPLSLARVARVAGISAFHFHRVFKAMVGETLGSFIKRVRLERAVAMMARQRDRSLTDIALCTGFSSSSDFSRCFKTAYGVPPRAFDVDVFRARRRASFLVPELLPPAENPDGFEAVVRDLPSRRVAYIRVHRSYEPGNVATATEQLTAWARDRGLADGQWLGYTWDDPDIVPLHKCRYDVGVEVPADVQAEGDVCVVDFPSMRVAQVEIAGPIELEMRALDWMFGTWLPQSGRLPADHPCFEAWNGRPWAHGDAHFELRLHLPVS